MNHYNSFSKAIILATFITLNVLSVYSQQGQKWATGGNAASTGDFIGTTNSKPLVFKTANVEHLRISPTGNIGIGVTNPLNKFEVSGNSLFDGDVDIIGKLIINGESASNKILTDTLFTSRIISQDGIVRIGDSTIALDHVNNKIYTKLGLGIGTYAYAPGRHSCAFGEGVSASADRSYIIGCGTDNYNPDGTTTTNYLVNNTPYTFMVGFNSDRPTFYVGNSQGPGTTGKVGIGTTDPRELLQVGDGCHNIILGSLGGEDLEYSASYIGFNAYRRQMGSQWEWVFRNDNAHNGGGVIMNTIGGTMVFIPVSSTSNNDQSIPELNKTFYNKRVMEICPSENTEPANVKINGTLFAKRVKVTLTEINWWDNVFDKDYSLLPIDSLKNYLVKNKHLPDIPSEKEVMANGLDLGEFNALLLKKIEELTLYIIEQNKRITILEEKSKYEK